MKEILDAHPELVNEVTTGGATPLHMCGMGKQNQAVTALLIERGGDMCVHFYSGCIERGFVFSIFNLNSPRLLSVRLSIHHCSEALDTYGYRPLHRMASNNLKAGAEALLKAGADPKVSAVMYNNWIEEPMVFWKQTAVPSL